MTTRFVDHNPTLETYWRAIIILGKNTACYKFAFADSLLQSENIKNEFRLHDLALPYALKICDHLKKNDKQITLSSSKFLDFCRKYNKKEIGKDELIFNTVKYGFKNVLDAFHNISNDRVPSFFEKNRNSNKSITITDNFYKLRENFQFNNLKNEVEARWCLWETAISLNINYRLLEINKDPDSDILFTFTEDRRVNVTSSRDALIGYQKGECFYCNRELSLIYGLDSSCEVDHFFPYSLGFHNINQIWNLVLACRKCNGEKTNIIPHLDLLSKLHKRNNYYIESHHPLKETIIKHTGESEIKRKNFLNDYYKNAVDTFPTMNRWKPKNFFGNKL